MFFMSKIVDKLVYECYYKYAVDKIDYKYGGGEMNEVLLLDKINSSDIYRSAIAELLGLTRQGLYNKLCGKKEFKISEVKKLVNILHLTGEEKERIFLLIV